MLSQPPVSSSPRVQMAAQRAREVFTRDIGGRRFRAVAASTSTRIVLAVTGLKVLVGVLGRAAPGWLRVLDSAGTIVLVLALGYLIVRILALLQRRLLWRVRRKLVLSYILIGFVPILLFVSFFLVAGALLLSTVSSSLVQRSFEDVMEDATELVAATVIDLRGRADPAQVRAALDRRLLVVQERYPDASVALTAVEPTREARPSAVAGAWRQTTGPPPFPAWLADDDSGFVITRAGGRWQVAARSAHAFEAGGQRFAVVADLPIAGDVVHRMEVSRGVRLTDAGVATTAGEPAPTGTTGPSVGSPRVFFSAAGVTPAAAGELRSVAFVDLLDWSTGDRGRGSVGFRVHPVVFYNQLARGGNVSLASVFLLGLMVIGIMFLTIEAVALVMGFALAKSITGAVHELFTGTERVRQGDLAHRIRVDTGDQLGELAESFNAMTGSIADLLTQAEEKRRLEEELRIAREIQMSLLPTGPVTLPGLAVTAACRPAREVGGDYYEFVSLGEQRLGVLVADVSGKGTSAAFYMAELKGLMLSLSRIHESPKQLLMEVNRILSANLDSRTFITMTYAVVDLAARTMTYARAGHTPLIYVPADRGAVGSPQVLIPDGLVVGLQLEGVEEKFAELLEECTLPIEPGDLFALFTDGITEAMNEEFELFGEERLSRLLADHTHLSSHELRDRILGDVEAFVGGADQHDDMTLVLLRIDELSRVGPTV